MPIARPESATVAHATNKFEKPIYKDMLEYVCDMGYSLDGEYNG